MVKKTLTVLILAFFCVFAVIAQSDTHEYKVGAGIYDITGPAAASGMMGYAQLSQITKGLHFRLRARAFVIEHITSKQLFVYAVADILGIPTDLKLAVVNRLRDRGFKHFTLDNVMLTASHTHSAPGGYFTEILYYLSTYGFQESTFNVIANGIVEAIIRADNNRVPASIFINQGDLEGVGINRSPKAYNANPSEERAKYASNVDTKMTLLKFVDHLGLEIGEVNWFAVHSTSMNNSNHLISGDNKGYASYVFEKVKNKQRSPDAPPFVAAFAQSNCGDVSPNICGLVPCYKDRYQCAVGEGKDMFESTQISGSRQAKKAMELYETATTKITGPLDYRHTTIDMSAQKIQPEFAKTVKPTKVKTDNPVTCTGAMGTSFAAGTTDGPGGVPIVDFEQGTTIANKTVATLLSNLVSFVLAKPPKEMKQCQSPKVILFPTGLRSWIQKTPLTPSVLPLQIVQLGQLVIIGFPTEITTMAGRRLRDTVQQIVGKDKIVVLAAYANSYASYTTTLEEYETQMYEAASTLFGPWALTAFQQEYSALATALVTGTPAKTGPKLEPITHTRNALIPVIFDATEHGAKFGDVSADVSTEKPYRAGKASVKVEFWGGHPKNNFRTEDTYLTVERLSDDVAEKLNLQSANLDKLSAEATKVLSDSQNWKVVANDGDWETKMLWRRKGLAAQIITIIWDVPEVADAGYYRIRHFGSSKSILGKITPYTGVSSVFRVVDDASKEEAIELKEALFTIADEAEDAETLRQTVIEGYQSTDKPFIAEHHANPDEFNETLNSAITSLSLPTMAVCAECLEEANAGKA